MKTENKICLKSVFHHFEIEKNLILGKYFQEKYSNLRVFASLLKLGLLLEETHLNTFPLWDTLLWNGIYHFYPKFWSTQLLTILILKHLYR